MQTGFNEFPIYNTNIVMEEMPKGALIQKIKSKDYDLILKLVGFGLSKNQIREVLGMSQDKFKEMLNTDEKLKNVIMEGELNIKTRILVGQLRMALPDPENGYIGNAALLKHLGMVHCGQSEKLEVKEEQDIHVVLKWAVGSKEENDEGDSNGSN